jgi:serine protease Do
MRFRGALAAAFLAGVGATACQTDQAGVASPAATALANPTAPSRPQELFSPPTALMESEPIEFAKVQYAIPRGTRIGVAKFEYLRCAGRGFFGDIELIFDEGRAVEKDEQFVQAFFDSARDAGLDVAGDPARLFDSREDRLRAVFSVAAEIVRANITACDHTHWWSGRRLDELSGEAEVDVLWHVYDKLKRQVVHNERTSGKGSLSQRPGNEAEVLVVEAFRDAARQLALSPTFRKVVAKQGADAPGTASGHSPLPPMEIISSPALGGTPADRAELARKSTVVIDLGDAHGSGFVIDSRGLVLTNEHVVGERRKVIVRLFDGTEIVGEVLRRDKLRDVALIRIGASVPALPMRRSPAAIAEEVYAIGAPLNPGLSSTLTKGIVSAIRHERNGLEYIQADVNIQAGSSGGPLLDASGHVVGISVAGLRQAGVLTGINFFVPIQDALARLNLNLVDKHAS